MIVAISGYIGVGKTTTANYIAKQYHFIHFNCDKHVKTLYSQNEQVIKTVNKEILNLDNQDQINIDNLKSVVFDQPSKLTELEQIVYPYLEREINKLEGNVLLDCQQVHKLSINIDHFLLIKSSNDHIIKRIKQRDNRSDLEINQILDIQREVIQNDPVIEIDNQADINSLEKKIDQIMEKLL